MVTFSASLAYLFTDRSLPDAIRAARANGFAAVECHYPYETDPAQVKAALDETGLSMVAINTVPGGPGQRGRAALPGLETEARADIDQAIEYAHEIGARCVHVLAGNASGAQAARTFVSNLRYASMVAAEHGITVLVEALNDRDNPGYLVSTTPIAHDLIAATDRANVRMMFDFYHVGLTLGPDAAIVEFLELQPMIEHVQFAGVPDRGEPDTGVLDYRAVFAILDTVWNHPLGAEYAPSARTEDSLTWMHTLAQ